VVQAYLVCLHLFKPVHPPDKFLAGFGLGALNDADEDDIDVYDGGHNTSKTKIAYDIAERESDTVVLTKKKSNVEPVRMDLLCFSKNLYLQEAYHDVCYV
jgi:hypothetical protein